MKKLVLLFVMVGMMVSLSWGQTEVNLYVDQTQHYDFESIVHPRESTWKGEGYSIVNYAYTRCFDETTYPFAYCFTSVQNEYVRIDEFNVNAVNCERLKFDLEINASSGQYYALVNYTRVP